MYLHSKENSNHVCVSAASPSESFNFDINDFSYLLLRKASAIFEQTDLDDFLI